MLLSAARGKAVKEHMEGMQTHKVEGNKSKIAERVKDHKKKDVGCLFYMKGGRFEILSHSFLRYRSPAAPQFQTDSRLKTRMTTRKAQW